MPLSHIFFLLLQHITPGDFHSLLSALSLPLTHHDSVPLLPGGVIGWFFGGVRGMDTARLSPRDQKLLYEYIKAISDGEVSNRLSTQVAGPLNHSRWLTLAIGLLQENSQVH